MLLVLNHSLAFLLELAALAAVGRWGWTLSETASLRILAAAAAVLALTVLWACFAAPKSPRRLEMPLLLFFKIAVFGTAALALHAANDSTIALLFGTAVVIHLALATALRIV